MRSINSRYVGRKGHQTTQLLFLFFLCLLSSINIIEATVHKLKWEIKYEYRSPDCFKKLSITINGLSPGPTITATQSDTLVIQVANSLITENTAIHWHGIRQSLLINGRGRYNCSLAGTTDVCDLKNTECLPFVLTMVPGKTYRLRIASLASLLALNLEIEGHDMIIVEADGHYVDPIIVKNLNIYSGETYSIIVKADQDSSKNYWIGLNVISRKPGTPTGKSILNYYPNPPLKVPPTLPPTGPLWNDTLYRFNQSKLIKSHPDHIEAPPPTSNRVIILLNTKNKVNDYIRWSVNNVSLNLPTTPYLIAIKENLQYIFSQKPALETYKYKNYDIYSVLKNPNATLGNSIHRLEFNSTVDIVLQNANALNPNNSEMHPWHLRGHDLWVLGYELGKFDPQIDPKYYNLIDPIQKNMVPLHPYGWGKLLRADTGRRVASGFAKIPSKIEQIPSKIPSSVFCAILLGILLGIVLVPSAMHFLNDVV